jgi:ankyrin repeat protein
MHAHERLPCSSLALVCPNNSQGHSLILEALVMDGASVLHRDDEGRTPLFLAAYAGQAHICAIIIEHVAM